MKEILLAEIKKDSNFLYTELCRWLRINSRRLDKGYFSAVLYVTSNHILDGRSIRYLVEMGSIFHHDSRSGEHLDKRELRQEVDGLMKELKKRYG